MRHLKIGNRLRRDERGITLVSALMMLLVLSVLAAAAVVTSTSELKISANYKTAAQALYRAESGIEQARDMIRLYLKNNPSKSLSDFLYLNRTILQGGTTAASYLNNPQVYLRFPTSGGEEYRAYLSNDSVEGLTSSTDSNGIVTITSVGIGPDGAKAVLQARLRIEYEISGGALPGAIVMGGPYVDFDAGNSNAKKIEGDGSNAAVAVDKDVFLQPTDSLLGLDKGRVTGGVQKLPFPPPLDSAPNLTQFYQNLKAKADFTASNDPGFTLGSEAAPKIVVIDGNYNLNSAGAGILVVTGKLTITGNDLNYKGLILVIGKGEVLVSGGGNGALTGGLVVANIDGGEDKKFETAADNVFGTSEYQVNGGGNMDVKYDSAAIKKSLKTLGTPLKRISWKQLQ